MLFFRTSPLRLFMICGFTAIFILTVTFWINCSDYAFTLPSSASLSSSSSGSFGNAGESERYKQSNNGEIVPFEDIECNINAEYVIACKKQGSEVYLPFSFIQKYFEVYGYVSNAPGSVRFEWSHSHGKINKPRGVYNPRGIFMYFDNYNVETYRFYLKLNICLNNVIQIIVIFISSLPKYIFNESDLKSKH
uniref:CSON004110 protein n=1 Tax=Culicoides sonorensis TaxID=179676 RepID=A0A336N0X0_CULSO